MERPKILAYPGTLDIQRRTTLHNMFEDKKIQKEGLIRDERFF